MASPELTRAEVQARVQQLSGEIEREFAKDARTRARLLEAFGLWVALCRIGGGRADWADVLEGAFPWPTEAEIEKAHKAARQRLGLD